MMCDDTDVTLLWYSMTVYYSDVKYFTVWQSFADVAVVT